jgi:hypothetical protein
MSTESAPRSRRGNMALEAALWIPIITLLIVGMIQIGKITYLYYTLKKTVYSAARYLATEQGTNFCDPADANIQAALQFALTGTTDGSGTPLIANLTPDMLQVTPECVDPISGAPQVCDLSTCGAAGGPRPDYIVVNIPNGYSVQPRIPFITLDPIPLKPSAAVPAGGGL